MRVYFHELSEEPKRLQFTEKDAWVSETVHAVEEFALAPPPAYAVDIELHRSQEVAFVRGRMKISLGLVCSRCANAFGFDVASRFDCLYTHDRQLVDAHPKGVAYSEPTGATGEDLEIEFLDKEFLELADVLKEQIYLKIPLQPLCNEDCKGLCPICGQDQNVEPCQCHRLKTGTMAAALKKVRLR